MLYNRSTKISLQPLIVDKKEMNRVLITIFPILTDIQN